MYDKVIVANDVCSFGKVFPQKSFSLVEIKKFSRMNAIKTAGR